MHDTGSHQPASEGPAPVHPSPTSDVSPLVGSPTPGRGEVRGEGVTPKLEGCYICIESPDSPDALLLLQKFFASLVTQEPSFAEELATLNRDDPGVDDKYREENGGVVMVAYDPSGQPIGMGAAAQYGTDVLFGRGYIEPEWRGTGLIQELIYARERWALARGGTHYVASQRTSLAASGRMTKRMGCQVLEYSGQPWWKYSNLATHYVGRRIQPEVIPKVPLLGEPRRIVLTLDRWGRVGNETNNSLTRTRPTSADLETRHERLRLMREQSLHKEERDMQGGYNSC